MKLFIDSRQLKNDEEIKVYINYRIKFAFARINHLVQSIEIMLADINDIDKQCKIIVKPNYSPAIVIVERQSDILYAADRCITRASRNISQKMKRQQLIIACKTG